MQYAIVNSFVLMIKEKQICENIFHKFVQLN